MSKTGEQTVRVLDEAYKTIRSGAPGLSDQTCNVLAGIIARKVSIIYAQPHPSQQAGAEGEAVRLALEDSDALERYAEDADDNQWQDWAAMMRQAAQRIRALAALKPVEG